MQPHYSPDCSICDQVILPQLESVWKQTDFNGKEDTEEFLATLLLPHFTVGKMEKIFQKMVNDFQLIIESERKLFVVVN